MTVFEELKKGIEAGDVRSLSRAITLAESKLSEKYETALKLIEYFGPINSSFRIGITGTPGAGKSTFIDAFGKQLLDAHPQEKVAVLSVDPSSSISGGSILGDKTRMNFLANHSNAFIRPTASGNQAGGLAKNTRLASLLCEAAGYKKIIIESVGVGQGETEISQLTDLFVLIISPGGGDELQGIKRGIVEMADIILVNKADGDSINIAKQTAKEYAMAQHIMPETSSGWIPKVLTCSSTEGSGLDAVQNTVTEYMTFVLKGHLLENRSKQQKFWVNKTLQDLVYQHFNKSEDNVEQRLSNGDLPERIAIEWFNKLYR